MAEELYKIAPRSLQFMKDRGIEYRPLTGSEHAALLPGQRTMCYKLIYDGFTHFEYTWTGKYRDLCEIWKDIHTW